MSAAFMLILGVLAPAAEPVSSNEELKKIQGEWHIVAEAWRGEPMERSTEGKGAAHVLIDKENFSIHTSTGVGRFRIKRIKNGEIDFIKVSPRPGIGDLLVGIYELRGDSLLKVCFTEVGPKQTDSPPKRPTEFRSSEPESHYRVYFLERKKEKK